MEKLRFVIAEDEAIILRSLSRYVEKMGHEVAGVALDGGEAVERIREVQPDMVLLDLNMPEKDGIAVIREACLDRMIPVIIITGHYSELLMNRADIPCVYGYLMKPTSEEQVQAAIRIAWSRQEEYLASQRETQEYKVALEDRKYIDRAKGILMDEFGLKEAEAMMRLRKMARDRKMKLGDVARGMVAARETLL